MIYVSDSPNKQIHVFRGHDGQWLHSMDQFEHPLGIAVDSRGYLIVVEYRRNCIMLVDTATNQIVGSFGVCGNGNGEFQTPFGVAVDERNYIYVVDRWNHRIQVFDPHGQYSFSFGSRGELDGELSRPWSIALHGTGDDRKIYVSEEGNRQVQVFNCHGHFLFRIKYLDERMMESLVQPLGITISSDGKLFVCDYNKHNVQVFDALSGRHLQCLNSNNDSIVENSNVDPRARGQQYLMSPAIVPSENDSFEEETEDQNDQKQRSKVFCGPCGIALTSDNKLIVSNCDNYRIQVFSLFVPVRWTYNPLTSSKFFDIDIFTTDET